MAAAELSLEEKLEKLKVKCDTKETTSCDWQDSNLEDFIQGRYEELSKVEEVNIAAEFLTFLFSGVLPKTTSVSSLLFTTASFLRTPRVPKKRILETNLNFPGISLHSCDFVYQTESFLPHLSPSSAFRLSLLQTHRTGIICYASFLATIILRTCVKSVDCVHFYIVKKSTAKFNEFFPGYSLLGAVPPIQSKVIKQLSGQVATSTPRFTNHFCLLLNSFLCNHSNVAVRQYLLDLLLTHTSHHGLRLLRDYQLVQDRWKIDSSLLLRCLSVIPQCSRSLELLRTFDEKYSGDGNILWPWARLVQPFFFSNYQITDHMFLGVVFVALLESFGDPNIWRSQFLKEIDRNSIQKAKIIARELKIIINE